MTDVCDPNLKQSIQSINVEEKGNTGKGKIETKKIEYSMMMNICKEFIDSIKGHQCEKQFLGVVV